MAHFVYMCMMCMMCSTVYTGHPLVVHGAVCPRHAVNDSSLFLKNGRYMCSCESGAAFNCMYMQLFVPLT